MTDPRGSVDAALTAAARENCSPNETERIGSFVLYDHLGPERRQRENERALRVVRAFLDQRLADTDTREWFEFIDTLNTNGQETGRKLLREWLLGGETQP